jgi:putative transposase
MYLRKEKLFHCSNLIQLTNPQFTVLAFCIMPDHYHLLLKLASNSNVSEYLGRIENSYSRFYNIQNKRKGPLWQSTFRATHIANNEQLLHVIRYIHLNPVTAGHVTNPRYWSFSSHQYYLNQNVLDSLKVVSIKSTLAYEQFILNNVDYQKKLRAIRKLL